jgi:hypothetical protein
MQNQRIIIYDVNVQKQTKEKSRERQTPQQKILVNLTTKNNQGKA